MDEFMAVALGTSYLMLSTTSFIGMGDIVTKELMDEDDMKSHKFEQKRGHIASAVECYMKENGATEEETIIELGKQVNKARKDINEEWINLTTIPMPLPLRILNFARTNELMYKHEDGFTHAGVVLKDLLIWVILSCGSGGGGGGVGCGGDGGCGGFGGGGGCGGGGDGGGGGGGGGGGDESGVGGCGSGGGGDCSCGGDGGSGSGNMGVVVVVVLVVEVVVDVEVLEEVVVVVVVEVEVEEVVVKDEEEENVVVVVAVTVVVEVVNVVIQVVELDVEVELVSFLKMNDGILGI
ncbi:unnamed protein product [Prunus armeniaca]